MATSYETLISTTKSYLEQDDLDSIVATLIVFAERRLNRELRLRQGQVTTTPTEIPTTGKMDLPTDFVEISSHSILTGAPYAPEYVPEAQFVALVTNTRTGLPQAYTLVGSEIWFSPPPDTAYDYEMTYFAEVPPLSTTGENWLYSLAPDIYLYATLLEAEPYLVNDARLALWSGLYDKARSGLAAVNARGKHRPGGRMRPYTSGVREARRYT